MVASVFCFSQSSFANINVSEKLKPYTVKASSVEHHYQNITKHGVSDKSDTQFHGGFRWHISRKYKTQEKRSRCRLKNLKINVKITYKLPELSNVLTDELMSEHWKLFRTNLHEHQKKHGDLVEAAAEILEGKIKELSSQKQCSDFQELISTLSSEVTMVLNYKHTKLDLKTDYGRRDGVGFQQYIDEIKAMPSD